ERPAEALHGRALHLPHEQLRVDRLADLVGDGEAPQLAPAGLAVDRDHAPVGPDLDVRAARRLVAVEGLEPEFAQGYLELALALLDAGHAAVDAHDLRRRLEVVGGGVAGLLDELRHGARDRVAAPHGGPARERALALGHGGGVL